MSYLYNTFFFQPLLNALVFLYETVALKDLGLAIILLTIFIRIILYPLFRKSSEHQVALQQLQPKIKKIQEEHKENKEAQSQAMLALFQEHKVNPFSGMFFLLIQLPIIIALYHIMRGVLDPNILNGLYSFTPRPEQIEPFFHLPGYLINLGKSNIVMVVLAAAGQYFYSKLAFSANTAARTPAEKMNQRLMVFLGPLFTLIFFYNFPAAVSLYWATSSIFSVVQQIFINRRIQNGNLGKPA